ncbi:hypothetical protein BDF21DRAFT_431872 [Thamnidium elegans]|uniref:Uncharacterized protein n=1 Tax=Thamnidium elegans TaxID=101142 RepID=A0A8H7VXN9_9FUNG|nr:hypothetical protein INT48_003551 [Thamnidium elegans]KAI8052747.1 hypothetical protein BDF21DRAFT_431872 [Thamnidium elegans]
MSNHQGPLIAFLKTVTKKGHYNFGVLQLQSNHQTSTTTVTVDSNIVCTNDIPFHISIPEFLNFVAPIDSLVSHYRVIRDTAPEAYMVLMKFRDSQSAKDYYKQYNDRLYSSMEPERCKVIYIDSIEIDATLATTFPFINQPNEPDLLPTCPVCLEPMDETVTGLLTILCQHTFHGHCLSKWGDGSCPVCRYSQKSTMDTQTPEIGDQNDQNECTVCKSNENLWVCLICGHIGCGRYVGAHAYEHYRETNHIYSLEINTQRVWDYTGDGYVHRLIQNLVDGKIVELPSSESTNDNSTQEKHDAISLEYSYLLTSQLDSQRIFYENKMDQLTAQLSNLSTQLNSLTERATDVKQKNQEIEHQNKLKEKKLLELAKEKEKADKKLESWKEKCESTKLEWLEEKEMTNSLLENNGLLLKSMDGREKAIKELSDQVRDLTFFLEAREKVQGNPELEGGNIETHTRPQHSKRKSKK